MVRVPKLNIPSLPNFDYKALADVWKKETASPVTKSQEKDSTPLPFTELPKEYIGGDDGGGAIRDAIGAPANNTGKVATGNAGIQVYGESLFGMPNAVAGVGGIDLNQVAVDRRQTQDDRVLPTRPVQPSNPNSPVDSAPTGIPGLDVPVYDADIGPNEPPTQVGPDGLPDTSGGAYDPPPVTWTSDEIIPPDLYNVLGTFSETIDGLNLGDFDSLPTYEQAEDGTWQPTGFTVGETSGVPDDQEVPDPDVGGLGPGNDYLGGVPNTEIIKDFEDFIANGGMPGDFPAWLESQEDTPDTGDEWENNADTPAQDDWIFYDDDNDPSTPDVFGPPPGQPDDGAGTDAEQSENPSDDDILGAILGTVWENVGVGGLPGQVIDLIKQGIPLPQSETSAPPQVIVDPSKPVSVSEVDDFEDLINKGWTLDDSGEVLIPPEETTGGGAAEEETGGEGGSGGQGNPPDNSGNWEWIDGEWQIVIDPTEDDDDEVVTDPPETDDPPIIDDDNTDDPPIVVEPPDDDEPEDEDEDEDDDVSGVGDFFSEVLNNITTNLENNFDLGGILEGGINIYGAAEQADAIKYGADKAWNEIARQFNATRDDLEDERDIGDRAINEGLWDKMSRSLTPDAREDLFSVDPNVSTGVAGQMAETFGGFEGLRDFEGETGNWASPLTYDSPEGQQLISDYMRASENAGKARGRMNTQETKDSTFKSYVRALSDIENLNAQRQNQEVQRRQSDFGISSNQRAQEAGEQLSASQASFAQNRENLDQVFSQLFAEEQQGFQNRLAANQQTMDVRNQYWQELLGLDAQEFEKFMRVAGMGADASARTGQIGASSWGPLASIAGASAGAEADYIGNLTDIFSNIVNP